MANKQKIVIVKQKNADCLNFRFQEIYAPKNLRNARIKHNQQTVRKEQ